MSIEPAYMAWVSDWYRADAHATLAASGGVTRNPQGPSDSFGPSEPGVKKRVHKGGSFLCADQYGSRYMLGGRGKGDPDTAPITWANGGCSARLGGHLPTRRA